MCVRHSGLINFPVEVKPVPMKEAAAANRASVSGKNSSEATGSESTKKVLPLKMLRKSTHQEKSALNWKLSLLVQS